MSDWPKGPTEWIRDRRLFISIPFTWNLKPVRERLIAGSLLWDRVTVGGPAVKLSRSRHFVEPFEWPECVTVDTGDIEGVLERANPLAIRTSTGCPNRCGYCAVPTIEPTFSELPIDTVRPVICDNNFLACSKTHRQAVYSLLEDGYFSEPIDFNQGLDARLLTQWDAEWLRELRAKCRLAYDYPAEGDSVREAMAILRSEGVAKKSIFIYALIGWKDTPGEAVRRCEEISSWGVYCCPMWFHELNAMEWNLVTSEQEKLGWTKAKRRAIMGYFWQHRGSLDSLK